MARVLIVDDEEGIRSVLADSLVSAGHETEEAENVRQALDRLNDGPFDVLMSDLRMPGDLDGMDLVRHARAQWPAMQVIVLTAHGSVNVAVEAIKLGAFDFIEKPISSPAELRALVKRAMNWRSAVPAAVRRENAAVRDEAEEEGSTSRSRVVDLFWQLKRRHVYTVAVGYLAVGFLGLQAAELVLPALPKVPSWMYPALVVLTLAGFPVAIVLGWVYDITRKGIRRTDAVEGP
jgi:two-component system, NtrC family, response regulator AtoC